MNKIYSSVLAAGLVLCSLQSSAQKRYVDEVFTDADVQVETGVTFATNIDFLTSKLTEPARIIQDLTAIKTALAMGNPIPPSHYNPTDTLTKVKVTDIKMDIYYPKTSVDTASMRPLIVYLHTGNFLPPGLNGSPVGFRNDSSAIVLCTQWAKRGYVAVSADYRLGWNPLATSVQERRGQLLNAVYRAIHDAKRSVIYMKADAAGMNKYKIDPNKVVLYGEGTGAYIAVAYTTLDKYPEMELTKFTNPGTGKSYIDTAQVGLIDGSGGLLNLYPKSSISTDVVATVAAGGALADTSWLEAGDPAMLALQCIRDPFAPFGEGTVIVPTTNEDVVDVQGANLYINKAVALGNNDAFKNFPNDDIFTQRARMKYGQTFSYIYPAPRDQIMVNAGLEGLFPVDVAAGASLLQNQAGPWQWWDPNSAVAKTQVAPGVTAHMASLQSNPDMSPEKGRAYIDTIQGYILPRLAVQMGYYENADFAGIEGISKIDANIYPNPTNGLVNIDYNEAGNINKVVVRSINGVVVASYNDLAKKSIVVDLGTLSNGLYLLEMHTDAGVGVQRIQLAK